MCRATPLPRQQLRALPHSEVARRIQDHVELTPELRGVEAAVVDGLFHPQGLRLGQVLRAARATDFRPEEMRDLDGAASHAPHATVHEGTLTRLEVAGIDQRSPSGLTHRRQRGRLFKRERRGFGGGGVVGGEDLLGKGSGFLHLHHAEDLVTRPGSASPRDRPPRQCRRSPAPCHGETFCRSSS